MHFLLDCYISGELNDDEIDEAINDREYAYELFMDCWRCDKSGTGEMAQKYFKEAKERLAGMKHVKE